MRLRSPSQVRVADQELEPIKVQFPELVAPLARAIFNGKCPACGAAMHGVTDIIDGHAQVQVSCFGEPAHAFFFDARSGRIDNQPTRYGQLKP